MKVRIKGSGRVFDMGRVELINEEGTRFYRAQEEVEFLPEEYPHRWDGCPECKTFHIPHCPTKESLHKEQKEELSPDEEEFERCPNCVTPWKCNGPHLPEEPLHQGQTIEEIDEVHSPVGAYPFVAKLNELIRAFNKEVRNKA